LITVDGEPVNPRDNNSDGNDSEGAIRCARLELKLCKALAALNPPHNLSACLHARITDLLKTLRRHDATDQDTRQAADLSDNELKEATGIIRAIHAMDTWPARGYYPGSGLRVALSGYALDLTAEIDARTTHDTQPRV
jgi:hypothetical protein